MANLEEILKSYSPKLHIFERALLREYLQYKILNIIFSEAKWASMLCFLGGTCLRIVHNNLRFSEDLDFDNFGLSEKEFVEISQLIKTKLEEEGYELEIRNVTKGAFRCYIRFPKLLYSLGLSGYVEEKILIQLDSQSQKFDFRPQSFLLQKLDVFTEIFVTPPDLLLAQKFYAILNRKRSKGRDFFDVVFLLSKTNPNFDFLKKKAGIATSAELKNRILEFCKNISLKDMAEDVRPFLIQKTNVSQVELFDKFIAQTL